MLASAVATGADDPVVAGTRVVPPAATPVPVEVGAVVADIGAVLARTVVVGAGPVEAGTCEEAPGVRPTVGANGEVVADLLTARVAGTCPVGPVVGKFAAGTAVGPTLGPAGDTPDAGMVRYR